MDWKFETKIKPNGIRNTNINTKTLYDVTFKLLSFHSTEQQVWLSSSEYFDQPNNGANDQKSPRLIDVRTAIIILFVFKILTLIGYFKI